MDIKTRSDAINLFGGVKNLADVIGITKGAVSQWDETLTTRQIDEVIGAGVRLGLFSISPTPKTEITLPCGRAFCISTPRKRSRSKKKN